MPGQTIATLVLLIASILAIASSLCENFAHKCGVRLGAPLSNIDGSDVLQLAANGRAYYHFQVQL